MDKLKKDAILAQHVQSSVNDFIVQNSNTQSLITITSVKIENTGHTANVFISTIPDRDIGSAMTFLKRHKVEISNILQRNYRVDRLPEIRFLPDPGK